MPEDDIGDEIGDEFASKFSIRALNFNMMSKLLPQHTMLARASSRVLTNSHRNRSTISSRVNNQIRKGSRISKTTGRESELYYYVDEGSLDEDSVSQASHRCSMVKRYNIPTFFTPDKSG